MGADVGELTYAPTLLCRDSSGTMTAFADMMRKQIVMPAHLMDDLEHQGLTGRSLFKDFSSVAQMTGTYTSHVRAPISSLPLAACVCQ